MNLPAVQMVPYFYESLAACGLGAGLWWLQKQGLHQVYLPILAIRSPNLAQGLRRRLTWQIPPMVPWVSFLMLSLCFLGLLLRPYEWERQPVMTHEPRPSHVIFDVSPSVAAHIRWPEYVERGAQLINDLSSSKTKLTFSTNHSPEIEEFQTTALFRDYMAQQNFASDTLTFAQVVALLKKSAGALPTLIIVSDKDQHNWQGFWDLLDQAERERVFRVNLAFDHLGSNLFFKSVSKNHSHWQLELERTQPQGQAPFTLSMHHLNKTYWSERLKFPPDQATLSVTPEIPPIPFTPESREVTWTLTPDSPDALNLDNRLSTWGSFLPPTALVFAANPSENALTDPAYFFVQALEALGYRAIRKAPNTKGPLPPHAVTFDLDQNTLDSVPMTNPLNPEQHRTRLTNLHRLLSQSNLLPVSDHPDSWELERVPYEESLLKEAPIEQLPPLWDSAQYQNTRNPRQEWVLTKESSTYLHWLYFFVLFSMSLELGWYVFRKRAILPVICLWLLWGPPPQARAQVTLAVYPSLSAEAYRPLREVVSARTSASLRATPFEARSLAAQDLIEPWLWLRDTRAALGPQGLAGDLESWIRKGGFLIGAGTLTPEERARLTKGLSSSPLKRPEWKLVDEHHLLRKTFFVLKTLPTPEPWYAFHYEGRVAILLLGKDLLNRQTQTDPELTSRAFINILMLALTGDYKNDSLHIRELLKRGI